METCGSCKYFEAKPEDRLGSCSRWLQGYYIQSSEVPDNEVRVENDEGWAMEMGRDFGCVLWVSRPTPEHKEE